jgi:hypothetical protein
LLDVEKIDKVAVVMGGGTEAEQKHYTPVHSPHPILEYQYHYR